MKNDIKEEKKIIIKKEKAKKKEKTKIKIFQ